MKNCEYWQQQVSRLLDGDLSPEEEAALWEHIADCTDCARTFEEFSEQTSVLRAQMVRPPVDLSRVVMARIRTGKTDAPVEEAKPVSHRLRSWKRLALAACFVLLVAAAAVTGVFSRGIPMSGGGESAAFMPEAQNGTVYASVPADDALPAETAAPEARQADEAARAVPEPEVPAPEEAAAGAQDAPAPAAMDEAAPAEVIPEPEEEPAPVEDAAPAEAPAAGGDGGVMSIQAPIPTAPPCYVFDSTGTLVGYVTDTAALAALFAGEPWQGDAPAPVYTLALGDEGYALAADEAGALLWRHAGEEGFTLSPASLADLEALIVKE